MSSTPSRKGEHPPYEPIAHIHFTAHRHLAGSWWPCFFQAAGLRYLPVAALPQIDYPTIQVQTLYPGASPDVMASVITAPLERQFGLMPGLVQMSSLSSAGASVVTLQFDLTLPLDVAEQEVQAAINAANNLLPSDLPSPPIYNKVNPADPPVITLAVTSDAMPLTRLEDLVDTRMAQKISQLPGVGIVTLSGGQRPAVRVQVNPKALANAGLTLADVRTAISKANVNNAKGSFDGPERPAPLMPTISLLLPMPMPKPSSVTRTAAHCACAMWPKWWRVPRTPALQPMWQGRA